LTTTQEPFEELLSWLNPADREAAGRTYELIRAGLIKVLISRGFSNAEDLADETIDRVVVRLPDIVETYVGPPAKYFFGVLRNVIREQPPVIKNVNVDDLPLPLVEPQTAGRAYDCLIRCLESLPSDKAELILDYYTYQGRDKIESHIKIARELGISENALRIRAYYIRHKLGECVRNCLANEMKQAQTPCIE
jgi:DNA-directed RNA polymerase specialized sigma24 family protein